LNYSTAKTSTTKTAGDLLVFPIFQGKKKALTAPLLAATDGGVRPSAPGTPKVPDLAVKIRKAGFTAAAESFLQIFCSNTKSGWLLITGMGEASEAGLDTIRKIAGKAAKEAKAMKARKVLVQVPDEGVLGYDDTTFARIWVEGAEMALSETGSLKTGKKAPGLPAQWVFLASGKRQKALDKGINEGVSYAAGCLFARRLVNAPPNYLTPKDMASEARKLAKAEGLTCKVLNVAQLRKLKMGGLLGVGQGSVNDPCMIVLEYKCKAAKAPKVALVGKGVTFDTGGISLKPGANMDHMKSDMGGAAAVLGAILIAARMKLPVNLTVVVPAAENMPDGNAIKPADVLTMANGKTVEVLNTDAEGRLILADALWYAGQGKPDYIMDAATLTGACVVALGEHFAGVMSNSGQLTDALRQAGGETFERVWPLPLVDEHKDAMKGTWSDLTNLGPREGGALTAAGFLSFFVDEKTEWAHIDIAGPSFRTSPTATCPKGGTGFGARLLARTLELLAN
jgi:leucyl aminopeptidase